MNKNQFNLLNYNGLTWYLGFIVSTSSFIVQ